MITNKNLPRYLGLILGALAFCLMSLFFYIELSSIKGATGTALATTMAWIVTPVTGLIFFILGYSLGIVIRAGKDKIYKKYLSYPVALFMIIIIVIIMVRIVVFIYNLPPG